MDNIDASFTGTVPGTCLLTDYQMPPVHVLTEAEIALLFNEGCGIEYVNGAWGTADP